MLQKMKIVDLNINFVPEHAVNYPTPHMIESVIDNKIKISYDMLDGYNFANQDIDNYLKGIDCYFKRSYNLNYHQDFAYSARIFPLGFNYHVTTKGNICAVVVITVGVGSLAIAPCATAKFATASYNVSTSL